MEMSATRSAILVGNSSPASFQVQSPFCNMHDGNYNSDFTSVGYMDSITENQIRTALFGLENHLHVDSVKSTIDNFNPYSNYYLEYVSRLRNGRRSSNMTEFPFKTCYYFSKGYCRHGSSCRFYHHGQDVFEMYGNDIVAIDKQVISLAQLESELVELLKQRGNPISIASLPMAYYDKYKKALHAEGYLAESQRHGKSGCNLTKLLIRLRNTIRLIDRPHGQHAVVLVEDAAKFMRKTDCQNISASHQIYLTFPADSTFSEEDVSHHFSTFGRVEDVRIPCQQKRMFGFVTFVDQETVKIILDEGNAHYVRGSRVLVKPYKEKSKLVDRKYPYRFEHHIRYSPRYVEMDAEITSSPISCGNTRYQTRLKIDEQNRFFEMQRRRLAMWKFAKQSLSSPPRLGINMNGSRVSHDHFNVQPSQSFNYERKVIARYQGANNSDEDRFESIANSFSLFTTSPVDGVSSPHTSTCPRLGLKEASCIGPHREGVHHADSAFSFRIDTAISSIM